MTDTPDTITWEDPPEKMTGKHDRPMGRMQLIVTALAERPGEWAKIPPRDGDTWSAAGTKSIKESAKNIGYQTQSRTKRVSTHPDRFHVWARVTGPVSEGDQ